MSRGSLAVLAVVSLGLAACTGVDDGAAPGAPTSGTGSVDAGATVSEAPQDPGAATGQALGQGPDETAATTAPAPAGPTPSQVLWSTDLVPASGAVLVDGVPVLYTVTDGQLMITALDAGSGEELWSHEASPSLALRGVGTSVKVVDDQVVHLEPVDGSGLLGWSRVVLRDPATGEEVLASDAMRFYRLPGSCPGSEGTVCAYPMDGSDAWRPPMTVTADGLAPWSTDPMAERFRDPVGDLGLYRATGQEVGRLAENRLLWSIDTAAVAGGDSSTNTGWIFGTFDDDQLVVGTVGTTDTYDEAGTDLTAYSVFALDADTGERAWLNEGMSMFCDADMGVFEGDDPLLACDYRSGVMTWDDDGANVEELDVDLVRLDPTTGEVLWRLPLTPDGPVGADETPAPEAVGEHHVVVQDLVVDVRDGSTRPATEDDVLWSSHREPITLEEFAADEDRAHIYPSSVHELPEGTDLEDAAPPWPLPPTVGAVLDDGSRLVSLADAVVLLGPPAG